MRQRLKWNDFFLMEVVKRGEVLYESAHPYLKAILQEQSIPFGRTHNLIALLDLLLPHAGAWEDARPHLEILNVFAVAVRYPGESADKSSAREAVRHATAVRSRARRSLSLPA